MSQEGYIEGEDDTMRIVQLIDALQKALKLYGNAPVFLRGEPDTLQAIMMVNGANFAAKAPTLPNFKGVILSAISSEICEGCDLCRTGMQH